MIVNKDNKDLKDRLSNFKFDNALKHLSGESEEVEDLVKALADTFGNIGWFGGSLGIIIESSVNYLIGEEY